jgi:hypothetical protein
MHKTELDVFYGTLEKRFFLTLISDYDLRTRLRAGRQCYRLLDERRRELEARNRFRPNVKRLMSCRLFVNIPGAYVEIAKRLQRRDRKNRPATEGYNELWLPEK